MGKDEMSTKCWLENFIEIDHFGEPIYLWDGNIKTNTINWDVMPCSLGEVY
jgi:hypothetical protein